MFTRYAVALAAALLLVACTGGGGGPPASPTDEPPPPVQDPDTQPPPVDEPDPDPEPGGPDDSAMMPDPEPEPPVVPPAPAGVTVSAGIGVAIVSWDSPFGQYREHSLTHIYRSTTNSFSTATHIGTSESFLYTDENLQHDTTYYYWIVWESTDGERGPRSGVVSDRTGLNPGGIPDVQPPPPDDDDDTNSEALEGPAVLERTGTAQRSGTTTYAETNVGGRFPGTFSGTRPAYSFNNWGLWARVGSATLFRADIRPNTFGITGFTRHIEGTQSGSRPVSGAAVWTGGVYAYDAHPDTFGAPVTGTARLEVDFSAATMDVDFTGFSGGHADLSWDGVTISTNGRFYVARGGHNEMFGAFYGAEHQGVAGKFTQGRLDGVFGATR